MEEENNDHETEENVDRLNRLVNGDPADGPKEAPLTKADFLDILKSDEARQALGIEKLAKADPVEQELESLGGDVQAALDEGADNCWVDASRLLKAVETQHDDNARLRRENEELREELRKAACPDRLVRIEELVTEIGRSLLGTGKLVKAMHDHVPPAGSVLGVPHAEPINGGNGRAISKGEAGMMLLKAANDPGRNAGERQAARDAMVALEAQVAPNALEPKYQELIEALAKET
jgi:hypothetical protein